MIRSFTQAWSRARGGTTVSGRAGGAIAAPRRADDGEPSAVTPDLAAEADLTAVFFDAEAGTLNARIN